MRPSTIQAVQRMAHSKPGCIPYQSLLVDQQIKNGRFKLSSQRQVVKRWIERLYNVLITFLANASEQFPQRVNDNRFLEKFES